MSSALRSKAVLKQTRLSTGGDGNTTGFFSENDLKSAFSGFVAVSKSIYLANNITDLQNAITLLNGLNNNIRLPEYGDVKDMGRTINVGLVNGMTDILVFRMIKTNGRISEGGVGGIVGFSVVSNKLANSYNNTQSVLSSGGV